MSLDNDDIDVAEDFAKLLEAQNRLLELQNTAKFTQKFTGKPQDTLPWIFAVNKFLRINRFQSKLVQFQRIFNSMDSYYQNRFMMDKNEEDDENNFTWNTLKE